MRPSQRFFSFLTSITLMLCSFYVAATPEITIHYKHIGFYGQTNQAITEQLSKQNPYFSQHQAFHNDNNWQQGWTFITKENERGCKISHVNTWLKMDYHLPRWLDEQTAPAELQLNWQDFYQGILMHLDGHKKIAIEALQKIEKAVLNLPLANSCDAIKQQADAIAQQHIANIRVVEAKYDQATQYGVSQGALWLATKE